MSRKFPEKERVLAEIKNVVSHRVRVESQEELGRLVLRNLKKENKEFSASPQHIKRLALTLPEIVVKAKTKRKPTIKKIDKCPVCDSMIAPLRGRNLLNKKITIGYKCVNCAYASDLEAFMPMKYEFLWKPSISRSS
jgi:hypothetical protein